MSVFSKGVLTGAGITIVIAVIGFAIKYLIDKYRYDDDFSDIDDDWEDEDFEMYCKLADELFPDDSDNDVKKDGAISSNESNKLSYDDAFGPIKPEDLEDDGK